MDSTRSEVSLSIENPEVASMVCDVAADLFRDQAVGWPGQLLRLSSNRVQTAREAGDLSVRLVLDADNRDCLFSYLDDAQMGAVVTSDKVTSKEDAFLHDKLLRAAKLLSDRSGLSIIYSSVDGERAALLEGVADAGAKILCDGRNHTKVALCDDYRGLVTSFNPCEARWPG